MPIFLKNRAEYLSEQMDDPDCDPVKLVNTYRQFKQMNPLISRWHFIYDRYLLPCFKTDRTNTMLDIGFGGGDIPLSLSRWAKRDGIDLMITGIDNDERAVNYVQSLSHDPKVDFRLDTIESMTKKNQKFDFVISNHLLHHLDQSGLLAILQQTSKLSTRRVLFNDIERGDLAYLGFSLFVGPFLRHSYSRPDGLRSIRRSYTKPELKAAAPQKWQVSRFFPYRLLLIYDH
ncbi:MAG: methyltransferase domain-containing protein [Balneolales bacterium]